MLDDLKPKVDRFYVKPIEPMLRVALLLLTNFHTHIHLLDATRVEDHSTRKVLKKKSLAGARVRLLNPN